MIFKDSIIAKAQQLRNTVLLLPESTDIRVLQAAESIIKQNISTQIILLGDADVIHGCATEYDITLSDRMLIVDPVKHEKKDEYTHYYYETRKHKGISEEQANHDMSRPMYFASMHMKQNKATAMVAGAVHTTPDVIRPAITIVGMSKNSRIVSSCFVMETENTLLGHGGQFIFSDCAIIPRPSTENLVDITLASAHSCHTFLETEPIISLLSFSSLGSAEHEEVTRVSDAVTILRREHPELIVDGELQMDAAVNPSIGEKKAKKSPTAGTSNTLIFPDLAAGNIAYKTAQQFGNMKAYGPFVQGLARPINDLSRGCSAEEIVITAAASLCQNTETQKR